MSGILRDKGAFKVALGAGVLIGGAAALWVIQKKKKKPSPGAAGDSPSAPAEVRFIMDPFDLDSCRDPYEGSSPPFDRACIRWWY